MKGAAVLLIAAAFCGCSLRTLAVKGTAGVIDAGAPAFYGERDPELAREALPAQLKLLEAFLESDPSNPKLLKSLSEGFIGYAFLFLEDEQPDRARGFYLRGASYALRLAQRSSALRGMESLEPAALDAALKRAGPKDVPGLYWTAYAWAGWADLSKDDPNALAALPKAARIMARVLELDPGFQYGGPDLWFGVYYAARPKIAGGDLVKAKAHFDAAIARSGGQFLTAKLLCAKFYAVGALDEELFRKLNSEVLDAPADALPQARLANEVAKRKAKKLLEKMNELF
ncbi:MAG: hypothetical protein HY922_15510 [Elusimicrobia bacterium]|nr:hypothetical protein [Elusimicrobiota bacterium]